VEDAFFGSDAAATDSAAYAALDEPPEPEERKNRLPLFIILGVLLLGGGIAVGVMIAGGGPTAPASTPSTASAATEAPASEAPPSVAAASQAPPSVAPKTEAPVSEAPVSVASAAPKTRPKRVKPKAPPTQRAKPASAASKAPATGRFAKLSGQGKAPEVKPNTVKTEAPVELPETLGQSQISGVIKRYKKGLHGCYQRQLKRDSSMRKANLKLAFSIERSGRTSNIKIDRKYNGTELKNCLNRLVRRWRFPQFTGEAIPVEYPLFFQASL
jgi:outer membrane biosynthesis protein TonB